MQGVALYPGLNTIAYVTSTFRWLAGGDVAATSQTEVVTRLNVVGQNAFLVIGTLLPLAYGFFVVWNIFHLYKSRRRRRGKQSEVGWAACTPYTCVYSVMTVL